MIDNGTVPRNVLSRGWGEGQTWRETASEETWRETAEEGAISRRVPHHEVPAPEQEANNLKRLKDACLENGSRQGQHLAWAVLRVANWLSSAWGWADLARDSVPDDRAIARFVPHRKMPPARTVGVEGAGASVQRSGVRARHPAGSPCPHALLAPPPININIMDSGWLQRRHVPAHCEVPPARTARGTSNLQTASEQKKNNLNRFKDSCLKANARIWP